MKNSFEIWKMNFTDYELDFTNYENLQTDFFSLPYFIREMIGKLRNKKFYYHDVWWKNEMKNKNCVKHSQTT